MQDQDNQLARIGTALRRRRVNFLIVLAAGVVLSLLVALLWPPMYRSVATVYVEPPDVQAEGAEQEDLPEQQIARVTQRVLTTTNLAEVVRANRLYEDEGLPLTERIVRVEERFDLETVSAQSVDSRGRPIETVVTFNISFEDRSPATAQRVLNDLVTDYERENLAIRSTRLEQRLRFLQAEAERISREIQQRETELARFLSENAGAAPGAQQSTVQLLERAEAERRETDRRLRAIEDRVIYLQAELSQLQTEPVATGAGGTPLLPQDQLLAAEAKLRALTARYGENHPDVVAAKREVAALEGALERTRELADNPELAAARAELAAARERYTENHPEVERLVREVRALEEQSAEGDEPVSSNPAVVRLKADLASALAEGRSLEVLRADQTQRIAELEDSLSRLPEVEVRYSEISRDLENLRAQYRSIKQQELDAGVALEAEQQRRGQKFVLIEEPSLPEEPHSPNRFAILFVGLVLSLGAAALMVATLESLDLRIHGREDVTRVIGAPPLAAIPVIATSGGVAASASTGGQRVSPTLLIGSAAGVLVLGLLLLLVHTQVEELPVLWFRFLRTVGL